MRDRFVAPLLAVVLWGAFAVEPGLCQTPAEKSKVVLHGKFSQGLAPDLSEKQIKGCIAPVADLLAERTGIGFEFDVVKTDTSEALFDLGAKLNDGSSDGICAWGIEFGWLAQKYPQFEPIVLLSNGTQAQFVSQILVSRQNTATSLKQLKGKRLARFKQASLMDRLVPDLMLRREGQEPKDFFVELEKPFDSAKDAIRAVRTGAADCVVVEQLTFRRLEATQPGLAKAVRVLKESPSYPGPVMFGLPGQVNRLRSGLWHRWVQGALKLVDSAEGQQAIRNLRFEGVLKPDSAYTKLVIKFAKEYPIERLAQLKQTKPKN